MHTLTLFFSKTIYLARSYYTFLTHTLEMLLPRVLNIVSTPRILTTEVLIDDHVVYSSSTHVHAEKF